MRSWRPFSCGEAGVMKCGVTPSLSHQAESRVRPPAPHPPFLGISSRTSQRKGKLIDEEDVYFSSRWLAWLFGKLGYCSGAPDFARFTT
jgi:hypothetical protein